MRIAPSVGRWLGVIAVVLSAAGTPACGGGSGGDGGGDGTGILRISSIDPDCSPTGGIYLTGMGLNQKLYDLSIGLGESSDIVLPPGTYDVLVEWGNLTCPDETFFDLVVNPGQVTPLVLGDS